MLKTAYHLGFEQALLDAGTTLDEFEKMAGVGGFFKNLLGKKAPTKGSFEAFSQSDKAKKLLARSATDTGAYQKVRGAAAQKGETKRLLEAKPAAKPTAPAASKAPSPEEVARKAQREATMAEARRRAATA